MFPWVTNKQKIARLERRIEELEAVLDTGWFKSLRYNEGTDLCSRTILAKSIIADGAITRDLGLRTIDYTCETKDNKLMLTQYYDGSTYATLNGKYCDDAVELFELAKKLYVIKLAPEVNRLFSKSKKTNKDK